MRPTCRLPAGRMQPAAPCCNLHTVVRRLHTGVIRTKCRLHLEKYDLHYKNAIDMKPACRLQQGVDALHAGFMQAACRASMTPWIDMSCGFVCCASLGCSRIGFSSHNLLFLSSSICYTVMNFVLIGSLWWCLPFWWLRFHLWFYKLEYFAA